MSNSISSNRSALKEFIASISTLRGDLSNITAPPFLLAENSTVELPQYWADHPQLFVAPASEEDPAKRALLVLKWFLGSLKNQQYAGRAEDEGVKKPLNAFLGELFLGSFHDDETGETRLVSEQVSHHPPVTACYLWNEKHGVRAEGFTCQEITFSGNVSIKQKGFAILHIDRYDEDYLIPLPEVKVKGVLTGSPYPELSGMARLVSSTGIVSEISFEGKGFLGGVKNGVDAKIFDVKDPSKSLYTVHGQWNHELTFHDVVNGTDIEKFDVTSEKTAKIQLPDVSDQDPWESRRAWRDVIEGLQNSNMQGVSDAKFKVEQGQRNMRKDEKEAGKQWQTIFFSRVDKIPVYERLSVIIETRTVLDPSGGQWKVNVQATNSPQRPFHPGINPENQKDGSQESETTRINPFSSEERSNGNQDRDANETSSAKPEVSAGPKSPDEIETPKVEEFLREKHSSVNK